MESHLLTEYIVDRLSAAANRDDIITWVCQRGRMDWVQAEALVADVEAAHAREIDRRHLPINLSSAVMVGLFGALVTVYAVLSIFEPLLGRQIPDALNILNDFGTRLGFLPDTHRMVENIQGYGLLPDFWRNLYTQAQSFGVGHDLVNILYVLASGYFFWPLLLLGLASLIVGSLNFFRNIFRITGR
jgi:hypothetical protein